MQCESAQRSEIWRCCVPPGPMPRIYPIGGPCHLEVLRCNNRLRRGGGSGRKWEQHTNVAPHTFYFFCHHPDSKFWFCLHLKGANTLIFRMSLAVNCQAKPLR